MFFHQKTSRLAKSLKIMKLTTFFLITSFMTVYASGVSQNVSFNGRNIPLEKVFSTVELQTGYYFLYPKNILKKAKPVSLQVDNLPLDRFLDLVFKNQPLKYSIRSKTINVSLKEESQENQPGYLVINQLVSEAPLRAVPIKGIVRDNAGDPLPGATILVKNSKVSTVADAEGRFTIDIKPDDVLVVSYVQHETKEIKPGPSEIEGGVLIIVLMKTITEEKEMRVISTGIFQKAAESYTGASRTVTAKQLQEFGNRNLITSLKNIDPAFNILENNLMGSDPNHLPDINIRGNSSLPNINNLDELAGLNTPLVILDGFQSTLEKMLDININDVESVTILKDASATAIYGSRGSNGVVVINTKRPAPGKLKISYRADLNVQVADLSDYNLLDARNKLALEERVGLYNKPNTKDDIKLKRYYNFILNDINQGVNTPWMELPLQTGVGQRHNLTLSGGENAFRYGLSAQINKIQGVMQGSKRNTFNGTVNLSYVYKKWRFANQLMVTEGRSAESAYGAFSEYARMNPYWRAFDERGNPLKFLGDPGDDSYIFRYIKLPVNPLYNASLNTFDKTKRSELLNNTTIELSFLNGLRARGQFGIAKRNTVNDRFRPAEHTAFANYATADIFRKGDYAYGTNEGYDLDGSFNLQYSKVFFQKHTLFTGLDYNIRQSRFSSLGFLAEGFTNANLDMMSMALQYAQGQKPSGAEGLVNSMGLTANVNYNFDDKYFIDLSARMDGSSQFGKDNRMAPFWAAGLGWNLHNEAFLKNNETVTKLKLRGSVGVTGSQNFSAYQALSTYRYYPDDRYYNWNGSYILGMGNNDLKWQQSTEYNVGMDLELFEGRIQLTGDYYTAHTDNLLSSIELPASNGFPSYVENVGEMSNKGYEIRGTGVLIKNTSRRLYWSVTGSVFHNENRIEKISQVLKDAQKNRQLQLTESSSPLYLEGYSTNTIWVVPSLGIDPSNGKEVYQDANGNPTYVWSGNDITAMGLSQPKFLGNFSSMLRLGNFALNASFGYRLGGQQYNQTLISKVENADYSYNVDARVLSDRWSKPGDKAAFKGLDVTNRTYRSSRFVQDERTLYCQNIYLEYILSSNYLKRNLNLARLQFSAGMDEPFRISSIRQERGTIYPFSKQFSISINATF